MLYLTTVIMGVVIASCVTFYQIIMITVCTTGIQWSMTHLTGCVIGRSHHEYREHLFDSERSFLVQHCDIL